MSARAGWFERLPLRLKSTAYVAGDEYAWTKHDALEVIDHIADAGFLVSGGEVWMPGDTGPVIPQPFVYGWNAPSMDPHAAREYIQRFVWDPADPFVLKEPYFKP